MALATSSLGDLKVFASGFDITPPHGYIQNRKQRAEEEGLYEPLSFIRERRPFLAARKAKRKYLAKGNLDSNTGAEHCCPFGIGFPLSLRRKNGS